MDTGRRHILSLYKRIIRLGTRFPSIKRDSILASIKEEFKNNRNEQDPKKISQQIAVAEDGIQKLQMYVNTASGTGNYQIDLK